MPFGCFSPPHSPQEQGRAVPATADLTGARLLLKKIMPFLPLLALISLLGMALLPADILRKTIDGVDYHLLYAEPAQVELIWKDQQGKQIRTFPEAHDFMKKQGFELLALMNGGIFEPGGIPSGLLIQDGKEWRPVNRREGRGNFFLQPNGIFVLTKNAALILATADYPQDLPAQEIIRAAVQSGPLLLNKGKIHPAFNQGSPNRLHRNGVGVTKNGRVILAMSDFHSRKHPNLYEFATLFRTLGCENALFLDGDLSQFKEGEAQREPSNRFGSIIAITKKKKP